MNLGLGLRDWNFDRDCGLLHHPASRLQELNQPLPKHYQLAELFLFSPIYFVRPLLKLDTVSYSVRTSVVILYFGKTL